MLSHYYADSDSPFDEALRAVEGDFDPYAQVRALDCYTDEQISEFESCVAMKLDCPCYADEPRLLAFQNALRMEQSDRYAVRNYHNHY